MIKTTGFSAPDGHEYLKCKTCKQEFYIVNAVIYVKTICFCPYCGDDARKPQKHKYDLENYNWDNESRNE